MGKYDAKVPNKGGKWIALVIVLLIANPALLFPLAFFGGIAWVIGSSLKKQQSGSAKPASSTRYTTRQTPSTSAPRVFSAATRTRPSTMSAGARRSTPGTGPTSTSANISETIKKKRSVCSAFYLPKGPESGILEETNGKG